MSAQVPPLSVYRLAPLAVEEFRRRVAFAHSIEPLYVNSWWRGAQTNARVGGNPFSQHLIATAADLRSRRGNNAAALRALRLAGLVAVEGRGYAHAQLFPASVMATRRVLGVPT